MNQSQPGPKEHKMLRGWMSIKMTQWDLSDDHLTVLRILANTITANKPLNYNGIRLVHFAGTTPTGPGFLINSEQRLDSRPFQRLVNTIIFTRVGLRSAFPSWPYTEEGFIQAKQILVDRYGRPTQVKRAILK